MRVQPLEYDYLPQLTELANYHLGAVVPGWALPERVLANSLKQDYTEFVTDPWVAERLTL